MSQLVESQQGMPPSATPVERAEHRSIPSLDGFRAIAVIIVFAAHAGLDHIIPGGFGVTLFFFLSGFLITTLMRVETLKSGNISIPNFYMRRILRIFPPLYITTTIALVLYLANIVHSEMTWLGVASNYLFFTNYFELISPYDGVPGCGPLWSLAVEEHFYMLFPLVFAAFLIKMDPRKQTNVLLGFCAVVLIHRSVIAGLGHHEWAHFSTDTRLDSIAFGCIMALRWNPVLDPELRERRMPMSWFWAGIAALLICFIVRNEFFRESVRYTVQCIALIPVFIAAIQRHDQGLFKLLNNKFMKWTAAFSYTIYLAHYIAFLIVENMVTHDPVLRTVFAGILVVAYAYLMYALVERPAGRLRKRFA